MTAEGLTATGELVELVLDRVRAEPDQPASTAWLDLAEPGGGRRLSICVGRVEGGAIEVALRGRVSPRPMTHDALRQLLDAVGGRVTGIVLGFVADASTFTADVTVCLADGTEHHLDWRPSDAVAVAVRCDPRPPIHAPAGLLAEAGPAAEPGDGPSIRLQCPCGAQVEVAVADLRPGPAGSGRAEADLACPACGEARTVELVLAPGDLAGL